MPLSRGDVVLVQFPYASGRGAKLRPAIVVQPDHNNCRLTKVILAPITMHRVAQTLPGSISSAGNVFRRVPQSWDSSLHPPTAEYPLFPNV